MNEELNYNVDGLVFYLFILQTVLFFDLFTHSFIHYILTLTYTNTHIYILYSILCIYIPYMHTLTII